MVETNTFGGSPVTLAEFDLADRAFEINKRGGELAREAAESFADGRHRWVIGSVGPGTKLPSLGNIAYDPLEAALAVQCRGLIAGGVDAILIETCQDTLQIKAAVNGAKIARAEAGSDIPIFVQVTVETTGTLLVGPDIAAAADGGARAGRAADGAELRHRPAGDGRARPLAGGQLARPAVGAAECRPAGTGRRPDALSAGRRPSWRPGWSASSREDGVNLIGGCCGTTCRAHRRAGRDAAQARRRSGPAPVARKPVWMPVGRQPVPGGAAAPGERVSSPSASAATPTARRSGARLQEKHDWDGCVAMGREQIGEGSQRARRLHRLRRPRRDRRDERGDPPLHRLGECAAGDRQHRDAGDRGGAEAAWRQADHQLDQLRGRREGRRPTG